MIQRHHAAVAKKRGVETFAQVIASLAAPALRLDAPALTDSDDTALATWSDLSGNGRDMAWTGANGEIKPSVRTAVQNGLRAVQWKGVSPTGLRRASQNLNSGWGINTEFTTYAAFKRPSTNTGWLHYFDSSGAATNVFGLVPWHSAGSIAQRGASSGPDYILASLVSLPLVTTWQVWCATSDGSSNVAVYDVNGTSLFSGSLRAHSMANFAGEFQLGFAGAPNAVSDCWIGHIGDLLIYPVAHSSTDRNRMLAAMKRRWGL